MKFLKELEQHIAKTMITYVIIGVGIFVAFYFTTTSSLAQLTNSSDTVKIDLNQIKNKISAIEKEPTKLKVIHLEEDVATLKSDVKDLSKEQRLNHKEIMNILLELKSK